MSLVPGGGRQDCADAATLGSLADVLAVIHAVEPTIEVREYQSWASEAKYAAPPWAGDPSLWVDAFELLRTEPPRYQPCFIHRDFQPRNVLWSWGRVSAVVDWVETSIGPAWLDVAHCSTAIAISHGIGPADAFAAAYIARTGREPQWAPPPRGTRCCSATSFEPTRRAARPGGQFKSRLAQTVTDVNSYGQIKASVQPLLMAHAEGVGAGASFKR